MTNTKDTFLLKCRSQQKREKEIDKKKSQIISVIRVSKSDQSLNLLFLIHTETVENNFYQSTRLYLLLIPLHIIAVIIASKLLKFNGKR